MNGRQLAGRLLVGNLDCETEWARAADVPGATRKPLGMARALSTSASLLRALAHDGDRLWTPAALDPARIAVVPGLPVPRLESGPLDKLAPAVRLLVWGETPLIYQLRGRWAPAGRGASTSVPELLWRLAPPSPEVAAAVNHRAFHLAAARGLRCALPGARMVEDALSLQAHLAAGGAEASPTGQWILKAPYSAAGRSRVVGRGRDLADDLANTGLGREVERLFRLHGEAAGGLLFEPWMDRTEDYGCAALLADGRPRVLGLHRQMVDGRGRFHGVELLVGRDTAPGLSAEEADQLTKTAIATGERLALAGYQGPYGIDAWRYRTAGGELALHTLGEVNARLTMGLVIRLLVERVRGRLGLTDGELVRVCFGTPDRPGPTTAEAVPLVLPHTDNTGAVWLER